MHGTMSLKFIDMCMCVHGHHSVTTCTSLHIHGGTLCQCFPSSHLRRAARCMYAYWLYGTASVTGAQHSTNRAVLWCSGLRVSSVRACLQRNILHFAADTALCVLYIQSDAKLTLRRLTSYIYGAPILDVSRSHTTTQHSR